MEVFQWIPNFFVNFDLEFKIAVFFVFSKALYYYAYSEKLRNMPNDEVAELSKTLAVKYAIEGNYGRAFAHYLVVFLLKPSWRAQFREEFLRVLCKWGTILSDKNRFYDVCQCYKQALEFFPDDTIILNNLGAHLLRLGVLKEASHYFRKCLTLDPYFLRAGHNLEEISNAAVDRWHFRMLNDRHRNEAFREAILKKIKQGFDRVLDVGTGTGILSLFASEGKAVEIYACEVSPTMVDIAEHVFRFNNAANVKLLNMHSSSLRIPEDITQKVSLLVTETFDAGLLGEHIVATLSHAWQNLLCPPHSKLTALNTKGFGVVVPFGATLYVTGVELDSFANEFNFKKMSHLFSLEDVNVLRNCETYDSEDLSRHRFKSLTETETVTEINFNDPKALTEWRREMKLTVKSSGRLDCFAVWFDLRLDEDIVLQTSPLSNVNAAWDQAIFALPRSVLVENGQDVRISVAFENSLLNVDFKDFCTNGRDFKVSDEVIKMLNNDKLGSLLCQVARKHSHMFSGSVHVLDCYPFPIFGFNFLICRSNEFRDKLSCFAQTENDRLLIEFVAEKYDVEVEVTVNPKTHLQDWTEEIDIALLDLIDMAGDIRDDVLLHLNHLTSLLKPGGIILPERVEVIGQFIYSDWLTKASKVVDNSVTCGFSIAEFINKYQVYHFIDLNLKSIDHITCTKPFKLFSLLELVNSRNSIIEKTVPRHTAFDFANAMVYWLKIKFMEGCEEIVTCDDYHQAALLFPKMQFPEDITFKIIRNDGLFGIKLSEKQILIN